MKFDRNELRQTTYFSNDHFTESFMKIYGKLLRQYENRETPMHKLSFQQTNKRKLSIMEKEWCFFNYFSGNMDYSYNVFLENSPYYMESSAAENRPSTLPARPALWTYETIWNWRIFIQLPYSFAASLASGRLCLFT